MNFLTDAALRAHRELGQVHQSVEQVRQAARREIEGAAERLTERIQEPRSHVSYQPETPPQEPSEQCVEHAEVLRAIENNSQYTQYPEQPEMPPLIEHRVENLNPSLPPYSSFVTRSEAGHDIIDDYPMNMRQNSSSREGIPFSLSRDVGLGGEFRSVIRELIDVVPLFDGNSRMLNLFIKKCEYVYAILGQMTATENLFVIQKITSKLTGRAATLISEHDYASVEWSSLKEILIQHFGDQKSEECLIFELEQLKIKTNESYLDFYNRIQSVKSNLFAKIIANNDCATRQTKMSIYNHTALQVFLYNLPQHLLRIVRFKQPHTLEQALQTVTEETNFQKQYALRNDSHSKFQQANNAQSKNFRPRNPSPNYNPNSRPFNYVPRQNSNFNTRFNPNFNRNFQQSNNQPHNTLTRPSGPQPWFNRRFSDNRNQFQNPSLQHRQQNNTNYNTHAENTQPTPISSNENSEQNAPNFQITASETNPTI